MKFLYKFPNEVTNCKRTEVNCRSWLIQWTNVEHDWYRAIAITVEICLMISYSNEWVFLFNINLFDIDMFNLWLLTDWLRGHSVSFIIISLKTFMKISISKIFNRNLFNISYIYIKKKKKKKERNSEFFSFYILSPWIIIINSVCVLRRRYSDSTTLQFHTLTRLYVSLPQFPPIRESYILHYYVSSWIF